MQSMIDLRQVASSLLTLLAGVYSQPSLFCARREISSVALLLLSGRGKAIFMIFSRLWLSCSAMEAIPNFLSSKQSVVHGLKQLVVECRVLGKLGLESTPINTKGYETLLGLVRDYVTVWLSY